MELQTPSCLRAMYLHLWLKWEKAAIKKGEKRGLIV